MTTKASSYEISTLRGYTTEEEVENYTLTTIDSSFSEQIDKWIKSVERFIEKTTGHVFKADKSASLRYFDGDGSNSVIIDECVEIEKIEVGTDEDNLTEIESTEYVTSPRNARRDRKPITSIELLGSRFPRYPNVIRVTARWGYDDEIPEDIRFAATVLLSGIINFSNRADGEVQSETIGRYSVTYKTQNQKTDYEQAKDILENYKTFDV